MAGKSSPWSIRRETAKTYLEAHKKYALQAGQVMWAWNELQKQCQSLFVNILQAPNDRASTAVWQTVASDQLQRDMLEAAASATFKEGMEKAALLRLRWALKETRRLAQYRNIAAHMPVTLNYGQGADKTIPHLWYSRATAASLVSVVGHKWLFENLIGELYVLGSYIGAIRQMLYGVSPGVFPRKPRLRLHRECQATLSYLDQPKAKAPRGRRRSSRALPRK